MFTPFNINDTIKQAEKEYGLGKGEYFKVKNGSNKIRILSPFIGYESEYQGKKNFKFVCWVFDYRDKVIRPYFMPVKVANQIGEYQMSEDYGFTEVPMPYSIDIRAKNAGTTDVEYTVIPSPKRIELPAEVLAELAKKLSIDEFVEKLKEKSGTAEPSAPTGKEKARAVADQYKPKEESPTVQEEDEEINVEDIPF